MKAAIYARYSTDLQRESSIEDQSRNCRKLADRENWIVVETFSDQAISGTRSDRPGYQRMLAAAKSREFDVLLVEDLSRLSRDQVEGELAFRRLEHWGVRIIGVADGYDSIGKGRKVHRAIKSLMNEVYLDDLAEKTHRGLEGQARAGNNAGGRAYGYRHVPVEDATKRDSLGRPLVIAVRREIHEIQATIVREIFNSYADGFSPRSIADELNNRQVPSPGMSWSRRERRTDGKWLDSAIAGDPRKGIGILNNDIYRGTYVWNRSQWVRDPETHKRVRQERPESEWIVQKLPELQIVSQDLWQRVKQRQDEINKKSIAIREALHANARTGRGPKFLLSGLLKCGECGANFVMANATHYACATHTNGGKHACANGLRVSKAIAESKLLAGIKAELAAPEYLEEFKRAVRQLLAEQRGKKSTNDATKAKRRAELEREIENMVAAVAAGLLSPALKSKLQAAESERAQLSQARDETMVAKVADLLPRLADTYREMVESLVETLENVPQHQVARARASLKQKLGDIRLVADHTQGALNAEISLDSARLLSSATDRKINVVAGVGFVSSYPPVALKRRKL